MTQDAVSSSSVTGSPQVGDLLLVRPQHDFLVCKGPDAVSFLQGLATQDIKKLAVGAGADCWFLNAGGKILFSVRVVKLEAELLLLMTDAGSGEALHTHLDRYLIMEDAELAMTSHWTMVSIQGEGAAALKSPETLKHIAHDRSGLGGVDIFCPAQDQQLLNDYLSILGLREISAEELQALRIRHFLPSFGVDMETGVNPLIYGHLNRVSHTKGCFIGQETVAKTRDRGRPPKLLVQLQGDAAAEPQTALFRDDKQVGQITSAAAGQPHHALAVTAYNAAMDDQPLRDEHGGVWTIVARAAYKVS